MPKVSDPPTRLPAGPSRRSFLAAIPALGTLAAAAVPSAVAATPAGTAPRHDPVYSETDHVRTFYARARF